MITAFQQKVYRACSKIPKGKVSTYKDIAQAVQSKAYRAVGQALNKNPFAPRVPCHRVVGSDGSLGGFASGMRKKRALLQKEGVEIQKGKIDLRRFGFRI